MTPPSRITAQQVADRAGVSRSTVSRVFTPGRTVKKDTRARILEVANELGYEPNALAQALISRRSHIVGILMGELSNPLHAVLHQSIGRSFQERGLISVSAHLGPGDGADRFISMFRQYQVGTVVLTSFDVSAQMIRDFRAAGLQVVLLNRIDEEHTTSAICADMSQGGRLAARLLIERGCQRIGICTGSPGSWTRSARLVGQTRGLEDAGAEPLFVAEGGYTYESGAVIAEALANSDLPVPDGILCPNDLFAIGLMDRLRRLKGMSFPEDMAIVGFDDIPMAAWEGNALTTVRLPGHRMAERTADLIARQLSGEETIAETTWIPCRIVRRSTA